MNRVVLPSHVSCWSPSGVGPDLPREVSNRREMVGCVAANGDVCGPAVGYSFWVRVLLVLGLGWCILGMAHAAASDPGYEAFRLVQTRNVFDPDRRAPRPAGTVRDNAAPSQVESMALTGTMVQGDRALAFFSGSQPEHRRVVTLEAEVAGYTLVAITTTHVELDRDGERLRLPVGQGLRRAGDGPWEQTADIARPAATPSTTAASSSEGERRSEGALSDLMKRMIQRRQQEVSR